MEVAVMIVIRSPVVSRRDYAYADTVGSRIETDVCCSRQSRADRNCRHKRNSKLSHVCLLCWLHYLNNGEQGGVLPIVPFRNPRNSNATVPAAWRCLPQSF